MILAVALMKHMILLLWNIHRLPDMQWYANELSNTIATPHEMKWSKCRNLKKGCVSWHGMGGCHRFWQPQPLLLILLCNCFSTIRSFSFESRFLGFNNYSTRLVRRITATMWPLFSTVLHTISGLKIDHRLTMLYCVFSIPRLLFDFWWYIPHTPKKQRWDKSYPLSSQALEHTDSIQPFGGSFAQGLRWLSRNLEILYILLLFFHFLNKLSLPKRGAESNGFFNLSLKLSFIARFV